MVSLWAARCDLEGAARLQLVGSDAVAVGRLVRVGEDAQPAALLREHDEDRAPGGRAPRAGRE
eukprot:2061252-Prymnesium_polylepis.1